MSLGADAPADGSAGAAATGAAAATAAGAPPGLMDKQRLEISQHAHAVQLQMSEVMHNDKPGEW